MAGTIDKLIHDYFDVDLKLMYDIYKTNVPELLVEINKLINTEEHVN
jgi:uncharacterized protein with HEPN domain